MTEGVGRTYDVGIAGVGYVLAENPDEQGLQYKRARVPLDAPRFATGDESFAGQVDRYSFTQWLSWEGGAFQTHHNRPGADPSRFLDSHRIDPFTERYSFTTRPGVQRLAHPVDATGGAEFTTWETSYELAIIDGSIWAFGQSISTTGSNDMWIAVKYDVNSDAWTLVEELWDDPLDVDFAGVAVSPAGKAWIGNYYDGDTDVYPLDNGGLGSLLFSLVDEQIVALDYTADRLAVARYSSGALEWSTFSTGGVEDTTSLISFPLASVAASYPHPTNAVYGNGVIYFGIGTANTLTIYGWRPGSGEAPSVAATIPEGGIRESYFPVSSHLHWFQGALYVSSIRSASRAPNAEADWVDQLLYQCVALDDGSLVPALVYESYDRWNDGADSGSQGYRMFFTDVEKKILFSDFSTARHPSLVSAFDPSTGGVARWFGDLEASLLATGRGGFVILNGQLYVLTGAEFLTTPGLTVSGQRVFTPTGTDPFVYWEAWTLVLPEVSGTAAVIADLHANETNAATVTVDISSFTEVAEDLAIIALHYDGDPSSFYPDELPETWHLFGRIPQEGFLETIFVYTEDFTTAPVLTTPTDGLLGWSAIQLRDVHDAPFDDWRFAYANSSGLAKPTAVAPGVSLLDLHDEGIMLTGVHVQQWDPSVLTAFTHPAGTTERIDSVYTVAGDTRGIGWASEVLDVTGAEDPWEGTIELSTVDAASLRNKVFDEVRLSTEPLPTGSTVDIYYSIDQGATYVALGSMSTAGQHNATFPLAIDIEHEDLTLKIVGTGRPVVNGVELKYHALGMYDDVIELVVDCRDDIALRNSSRHPDNGPGAGRARYRELAALVQTVVNYEDIDSHVTGDIERVEVVEVMPVQMTRVRDPRTGFIESGEIARVTLRKVGA